MKLLFGRVQAVPIYTRMKGNFWSSYQQLRRKAHAGGKTWQTFGDLAKMLLFCLCKTYTALLVQSSSTADHLVSILLLAASRPNQSCQTGLGNRIMRPHTRRFTWTAVSAVAAHPGTPQAAAPAPPSQEASSLSHAATAMPRTDIALHAAGRQLPASCSVPEQQHMPS